MTRWTWAVAVVALGATACQKAQKPAASARAEIKKVGGSTVEFIPQEGQHPYCLLYTVSEKGIIRQLTMTRENRSLKCDAGKRIYNSSFRIPTEEGKVRAYIFFSDQRIQAGSVAQQLHDLRDKERVTAMDFRLPGSVTVEMLEFIPEEESEPVTGAMVGTTDLPTEEPETESEAGEEEPGVLLEPTDEGAQAAPAEPSTDESGTKTAAEAVH